MTDLNYYRATIPGPTMDEVLTELVETRRKLADAERKLARQPQPKEQPGVIATDEARLTEALQKAVRYKNLLTEERAQRKDEQAYHETHLQTLRARTEALHEQIRVLTLANRSLGDARTVAMRDLLGAALAWREAINPARPDGVAAAEDRLKAAIAAVEDVK